MAAKVFQTGLLTTERAGDIGWSRVPLGLLHGERGAAALQQSRRRGAPGRWCRRCGPCRGQRRGAAGWAVETSGGARWARTAWSWPSPTTAPRRSCPRAPCPASAAVQLGSSPIVNVHVHFDRRVMDLPLAAGLGTVAQWVFDRTASSGAGRGQYLAVSISAADDYSRSARPGDLGDRSGATRSGHLPRGPEHEVLSTFVTREHHATFRASPGSRRPPSTGATRLPGLVLAGAWTSTGWPPTMESAVRSGVAPARAVLVAAANVAACRRSARDGGMRESQGGYVTPNSAVVSPRTGTRGDRSRWPREAVGRLSPRHP